MTKNTSTGSSLSGMASSVWVEPACSNTNEPGRCDEVVLEGVPPALERVRVHGAVVVVGRDALPGASG